jgi:hypothetical protein
MPVPPQESAPSLSPRQSFGCQSPLPWVTGTDRTGILWALWQLQGFLPGVLFSLCALSHLEESLTGQQASRSPALRGHSNPPETQTQVFPNRFNSHRMISQQSFRNRDFTHRLTQLSRTTRFLPLEILTGFSRAQELLSQVISETRVTQSQTQTHSSGQGVHDFLRTKHSFTASRDKSGYSGRWSYQFHAQRFGSEWRKIPHPRFSLRLIFACTRVDTCHPGNCMRSIRTFSSHHLGTHGSFQKDLG